MAPEPQKILGIDLGTKRVGLAIGDTQLRIATALDVIEYKSKEFFLSRLGDIIKKEEIDFIVLGLPKNMDGSEGVRARASRQMARLIKKRFNMEIILEDERLTTVQAIRELHASDGKVGKSRGKIDMISAALILQNYLDSLPSTQ